MRTVRTVLECMFVLAALTGRARALPAVAEEAPRLVIRDLDGSRFDLSALRGKVVIVNFWATWCPPCREEMPVLDAFYSRVHSRGVELIGISLDHKRDRKDVLKAAESVHYPVAVLADADANGFGTPAVLPVTYVVDPEGVVRAVMTPASAKLSEDALERVVMPLLL
jgi:cytochrome c biogenesis protein CcmG, thiol:disulfide interchange protein DsbE